MIVLDPDVALLAVLTTGVGFAMVRLGLRTKLLDRSHKPRPCQACGHPLVGGRCPSCEA
jgi:hypothetical protein